MRKTLASAFGQDAEERDAVPVYPSRRLDCVPSQSEARTLLRELVGQIRRASPVAPAAPLVIYGAGNFGRMALDFLHDVGVEIACVIDARADQIRGDAAWAGVDLRTPAEVPASIKSEALIAVSVVTSPVTSILEDLRNQGWKHCVPFYDVAESFRPAHPLSNGWFADPLTADDLARLDACLDDWADDISRAHHLMFLAWRLARQEWRFPAVAVDNSNRFFITEVTELLRPDDLMLDGGAHHGGVSQAFLAATGPASRIVAFEPDAANAHRFAAWRGDLPGRDQARVELRRVALDATPRIRTFHSGLGYMSQFAGGGSASILATTIDAEKLAPGYVKLHLEGAELDALKGGLATFTRSRPIIAATVYHNADGLWRTANWMRQNLDRYSLLFRTHSWCGTGAVIYALPEERKAKSW